jgi:Flp pilus assembly protein TadD
LTVLRRPDASADEYSQALEHAEVAAELDPDDFRVVTTLGFAQYRVGQSEQAIKTLSRADKLMAESVGESHPSEIVFLAMTQHHLGRTDEARQLLGRLRELLEQDRWRNDAELQRLLRDASATIEQESSSAKE